MMAVAGDQSLKALWSMAAGVQWLMAVAANQSLIVADSLCPMAVVHLTEMMARWLFEVFQRVSLLLAVTAER